MDPITLLLTAGPTLIRVAGSLFGGKTSETANTVAGLVDAVSGLPAAARKEKLEQQIAQLPPEAQVQLQALQVQLVKIEQEREAARLTAETAQQAQVQETSRVEAQSSDEYVRRTRPMIARQSAQLTFYYAFTTEILFQALVAIAKLAAGIDISLPRCDPYIAGALFSPCLTYIGARSFDAFSRKGKT